MAATPNKHHQNPSLECASLSLVHSWLQQYFSKPESPSIAATQRTATEEPHTQSTLHSVINIKPLALCIANQLPPQAISSAKRTLVDGYIRELQTRAPDYRHRQVAALHWHNPLAHMDEADITEVMYHLGRAYRLSDHQQADYSVRLHNDKQKEDVAALFKGLGFNRLEVVEPSQSPTTAKGLRNLRALADDYQYQQFQLTLEEPCPSLHTRLQQAFKSSDKMPDLIKFHSLDARPPTRLRAAEFYQLLQGMRAQGYRILGNDCFVKAQHELAYAQNQHRLCQTWLGYNAINVSSVLGIGPGNISQEGRRYDRNPSALAHYLNTPARRHPSKPAMGLKPHATLIIDALLCYHRLDLKYLAERYDLHPLILLHTHQHHLTRPLLQLFDIDEQYCQLTLLGVTYLEEICRLFMRHTPKATEQ